MTVGSETLYTFRDTYPAIFEVSRDQVSKMEAYRDGALVAPDSGTYALLDASGTVVASPSVSIVASVATVTVPSSALGSLGEGYRERWTLVMPDGTTRTKYRDAAVSKSPLHPPLTDADLLRSVPDLARNLGTSAANFQGFLDDAWNRILLRFRSNGELPYVVVQASALSPCLRELAFHLIYLWWYGQTGSERFAQLYQHHWDAYEREWAGLTYTVDRDQDGVADSEDRTSHGSAIVHINAAPSRYRNRLRVW